SPGPLHDPRSCVGAVPRRLLHDLGLQARCPDPFRYCAMTIRHEANPPTPDAATDALPPWQPLLALSGVAFAPLFVVGWLASAVSNSPNYIEADQKWIKWAHDDHIKGRVSSFALVLAVFLFIYFLASLRSALEEAETLVRGSKELARVAFAGALTGIVGITMAF